MYTYSMKRYELQTSSGRKITWAKNARAAKRKAAKHCLIVRSVKKIGLLG